LPALFSCAKTAPTRTVVASHEAGKSVERCDRGAEHTARHFAGAGLHKDSDRVDVASTQFGCRHREDMRGA
jgi:hypothetical protein